MNRQVAVMVLTFNESGHLARALESARPFARSLHVIDCGSTDETIAIAKRFGAEVMVHPWKNYADQFEWGLANIQTDAPWIMRLDADEVVEADLAERLVKQIPLLGSDVAGINIDRKTIFMGRWIRHGGRYPLTLLRVFRRGQGRIERRWMDEHLIVWGGRTIRFKGGFADDNLNGLGFFIDKHNLYATREAVDVLARRHDLFGQDDFLSSQTASSQVAAKRWAKLFVYNRLPYPLASLGYFFLRYVLQAGFLDGRAGLVYHFLQGFWYRFLVGAKVEEFERHLVTASSKPEMLRLLSKITGLQLEEPDTTRTDGSPAHGQGGRVHDAGDDGITGIVEMNGIGAQ